MPNKTKSSRQPFPTGRGSTYEEVSKKLDKLRKDLKDASKKLTVHQEPRSKMSAELRSMMDQPRRKKVRSPHTDKKKSKYKDIFKKKT
tara:strand:+ start:185 stop:448 length:264 start_codon:yes stop_codon:yes gene_type:complete